MPSHPNTLESTVMVSWMQSELHEAYRHIFQGLVWGVKSSKWDNAFGCFHPIVGPDIPCEPHGVSSFQSRQVSHTQAISSETFADAAGLTLPSYHSKAHPQSQSQAPSAASEKEVQPAAGFKCLTPDYSRILCCVIPSIPKQKGA